MKRRVARRLVRRATRHDPPTRRGRRALRRLERAIRRGDRAALTAVWQGWLDRPSPALWEILSELGGGSLDEPAAETRQLRDLALGRLVPHPRDDRSWPVLVAALRERDHPLARTAADLVLAAGAETTDAVCAAALDDPTGVLAAFCVEHRLTPTDPVARAMFLVRTGQGSPDTDLLAAGYAGASVEDQARLRAAMLDADLVGVVVGESRSRVAMLSPDEVADLVRSLTAGEDWAGLWRLAGDVSPASAVELARAFPDDWRPGDRAGRRLFETLTATPPEAMAVYGERHRLPGRTRAVAVSFAPDSTQVAIFGYAGWAPGRLARNRLAFYALPDRTPLHEHRWLEDEWYRSGLLHVGGGTAYRTGVAARRFTVDGTREDLPYAGRGPFDQRAEQHRDGYVSGHHRTVFLGSYADPEHPREVDLTAWDLRVGELAVEPGTGRFALLDGGSSLYEQLVLFDPDGQVLATGSTRDALPRHRVKTMAFAGPDRLITGGSDPGLVLWHRDGDRLDVVTTSTAEVYGLHALPTIQKLAAFDEWHDTESLLPTRPAFPTGGTLRCWGSVDDEWIALASYDKVWMARRTLPAELARLVDRPLASMGPADLSTVVEAAHPGAAATVIRAGLEHRLDP